MRRFHDDDGNNSYGYDVVSNKYTDLVSMGIIDPAKVTRSAVENAASIAGMILSTEALITDIPEEEKPPAADHGHGPGPMGMGM